MSDTAERMLANDDSFDPILMAILDTLLGINDQNGKVEIPLTVVSGGQTISGIVITRFEWADLMNTQMRQALGVSDEPLEEPEDLDVGEIDNRFWINMKDVKNFQIPAILPLWRGRMREVSSWSLGRFS